MAVFQREVLPNGVRLLSAPMPQVQSVACFIMLAAGSRYETPETSGIAHFAEHMFFKGTENRPTAQIIGNELDGIGAEFNAFTGKEYTGYYVKCAAEHRGRAFDVLVDMLRHSKFDSEEIEREKGVIVEEMNMYFDTPRDYIGGVYHQLLYGDTPLGWDIIGRKETVRGRDARDLPRVRRPLVHGAEDGRRRRRELRRGHPAGGRGDARRGRGRRSGRGRPGFRTRTAAGRGVRIHSKESDQAHIAMGVPSYPLTHPDRYALQLLGTVLGTGMSSRLFTEVRERRGLAYYVFATNHSYTDTGTLYSQAGVDINRIDEAIETIARELKKIAAEPVPADELEKSKNVAKGRFVLATESPHGMITFGLRREVLEGQVEEPEDVLAGIDAVTVEDVQRVAQDVIGQNGLKLALIGPFDDAERFEKVLAG